MGNIIDKHRFLLSLLLGGHYDEKRIHIMFGSILVPINAHADNFSFKFDWSTLKKCTNGKPKTVKNPTFTLKNVPDGTKWIYFKLVDHDARSYNHGGGWAKYKGQSIIKPGAFKYKSPCPPNGKHKYEWTASAKVKKSSSSDTIQKAKSSKIYP